MNIWLKKTRGENILKIIIVAIIVTTFTLGIASVGFCKGGGGARGGGARATTGTFKSAPKASSGIGANSATGTGFGSKIKSWFNQRGSSGAAKTYSTPATATNNSYFSNGRYNGWTGIFWGYMLGRALTPHSTPVTATTTGTTSDGKYELAGAKEYVYDEPSVGDDFIAYGALALFIVLLVLLIRMIYRRVRRLFGSNNL